MMAFISTARISRARELRWIAYKEYFYSENRGVSIIHQKIYRILVSKTATENISNDPSERNFYTKGVRKCRLESWLSIKIKLPRENTGSLIP